MNVRQPIARLPFGLLVVVLGTCSLTCRNPIELIPTFSPAGLTKLNRPVVKIAFDRPMVPADKVGKELDKVPSGVQLVPDAEGRWHWLNEKTLAFVPQQDLRLATRYSVSVSRGMRALDGVRLHRKKEGTFETTRPHIAIKVPESIHRGGTWFGPRQRLSLRFTQPIDASEIAKHCAFHTASGARVALQVVGAEQQKRALYLQVEPEAPLKLDTAWRLRCGPGVSSVHGPLGSTEAVEHEFRIYSPLKVVALTPQGKEPIEPDWATKITITFNNPISYPLRIQTEPSEGIDTSSCSRSWSKTNVVVCKGNLEPKTTYKVYVEADQEDAFGQTMGKKGSDPQFAGTFQTGPAKPRIDVENGLWVVEAGKHFTTWTRNIDKLLVEGARIPPEKLGLVAQAIDWWDSEWLDFEKVKIPPKTQTISINHPRDKWGQVPASAAPLFDKNEKGVFYLRYDSDDDDSERAHELLLNVTDLALTTKLGVMQGLAWVTRLSNGSPVRGATVEIYTVKGKRVWRGRTTGDGTVKLPGREKLAKHMQGDAAAGSEDGDDGEDGDDWEDESEDEESKRWAPKLFVVAKYKDDWTFNDPYRSGALSAYSFNLRHSQSLRNAELRGYIHTDRGIYQAGDTVHIKGMLRVMRPGRTLELPKKSEVSVEVKDPRGGIVLKEKVELGKFGSFIFDLPVRKDAHLGDYDIRATHALGAVSRSFAVEDYEPANFEVKTKLSQPYYRMGQKLDVSLTASFFYGAPLRRGKVNWSVHRRKTKYSLKKHPGFAFVDEHTWYDDSSVEEYVTESEDKTNGDGQAFLKLALPRTSARDYRYLIKATVADDTNQRISSSTSVAVARSPIYLGIKTGNWMIQANKSKTFHVIAVSPDQKRIAAKAHLRVYREENNCVWEKTGRTGAYRCSEREVNLINKKIDIPESGQSSATFTPKINGKYWIEVASKKGGVSSKSAYWLWVWGGKGGSFKLNESIRFELMSDKTSYKPGETARILLKTPIESPTALVTVERRGVLDKRVMKLRPNQRTIAVPIKDGYAPNIYVSVALFKGRTSQGQRGFPLLAVGMKALSVSTERKRLTVVVTPEQSDYRPGTRVSATISVSDYQGNGVPAEVAVSAADEGVLSLIGFSTPNPLSSFYASWPLGIVTATQYDRLRQPVAPGTERPVTGGDGDDGGGGDEAGSARSRFVASAFWDGRVLTDAQGKATISFEAPDNLTAFRIMAVAADQGDRFGAGDTRIRINKPLQLKRALPRFLRVGDVARVGVVVHNESGKDGVVRVGFARDGTLEGENNVKREIDVKSGARKVVRFNVAAKAVGTSKLRFSARLGDFRDLVEYELPVIYATAELGTAIADSRTVRQKDGSYLATVPLKLASDAISASLKFDVSLSTSPVTGLEEGLDKLIRYPYGCLEQTTSKMIPMLAVKSLKKTLGASGADGSALKRFVKIAIAKIGKHQVRNGGFSLWPGGQAETYYSAYALWGLHLAKTSGFAINRGRVTDGVQFLEKALNYGIDNHEDLGGHNERGNRGEEAFATYVVSLYDSKAGNAMALLKHADTPLYGKAFAAMALRQRHGRKAPITAQAAKLLQDALQENLKAGLVVEPGGEDLAWYMSSDVRTTAIALLALQEVSSRSKLIGKLARTLMRARKKNYQWWNTQEQVYSLLALARYARRFRPQEMSASLVAADGTVFKEFSFDKSIRRIAWRLEGEALAKVGKALTIRSDRKLYYRAALRYHPEFAKKKARRRTIGAWYNYRDLKTRKRLERFKVGDVVKLRVALKSREPIYHAMVSHHLPAAFSPINPRLKTNGTSDSDDDDSDWRGYQYLEVHKDRVDYTLEEVDSDLRVQELKVRVTTPGRFRIPATIAEAMYNPRARSRSLPREIEVVE